MQSRCGQQENRRENDTIGGNEKQLMTHDGALSEWQYIVIFDFSWFRFKDD